MINLKSPLSTQIGYGICAFNIFKSLIKDFNQEICYSPIGQPDASPEYHNLIQQSINNQEKFETTSPSLTIWHENDLFSRIGKGLNCGLSFFELNKFSERTKRSIICQDIFIVASQWASTIVREEIPNQHVEVIEMGVDSNLFKPLKLQNQDETYRFLNLNKWEIRKGHDVLVEIFNSAFCKEDNVELIMSCNNPFLSEIEGKKWMDLYKNSPLGEKIKFIPRIQTKDLINLYNSVDCGIFPTRAEAVLLPCLEMMSCSKPIIITNYSGHSEYCNQDNSFLVDIDELEPANDGIWFHSSSLDEGGWAKIGLKQEEQFIEYMRYCYKNRINQNPEGRKTAEKFTWTETTRKILEILK